MTQEELQKILDEHAMWLNENGGRQANLQGANLRGADLRDADLRRANLVGANIDYSAWPLWCGTKNVKVDTRIAEQLAGHGAVMVVVRQDTDSDEVWEAVQEWQAACRKLGRFGHRAKELGLLEEEGEA